jgi:hypothetical protein
MAVQLHARDLGEHPDEPFLDDLEARQRPPELVALLGVGQRDVVGGHRVSERAPGDRAARRDEHAPGILERARAGEP